MSALPRHDPEGADLECSNWHPCFRQGLLRARSVPIAASAFLEHSFQLGCHPEGAQLQTPRPLCNANQGAISEGSFKSVPDPKLNANIGAASRYFANMQGQRTPRTFSSRLLYSYYWEEVFKTVYAEAARVFLMTQIPLHREDHKACTSHPRQPIFQHSSLTRNKLKHVR